MTLKLEDIVQKVVIEGDDGKIFDEIGRLGKAAFDGIAEAALAAGTKIGIATAGLSILAGLLVSAIASSQQFVEEQLKLAQSLDATAKQLGINAGEARGLENAFARVGVESPKVIQRAMSQIAKDIGDAFINIPRKVQEGQFAVEGAAQGISSAQTALSQSLTAARFASQEWAFKVRSDALSVAEAFNKVRFSSQDAAAQARNDALGIKGAQLSLREAQAQASGQPNTAELEAIKKERAALAVEQAQGALEDAQTRQFKNIAQQPISQARDQLGLETARSTQEKTFETMNDALDQSRQAIDKNTLELEKANFALEQARSRDITTTAGKLAAGQSTAGVDANTIADAIKKGVIEAGGDTNKRGEFFVEELKRLEQGIASGAIQPGQRGDIIRGFGVNVKEGQAKIENLTSAGVQEAMKKGGEAFSQAAFDKLISQADHLEERRIKNQEQAQDTAAAIAGPVIAAGDLVNSISSALATALQEVFKGGGVLADNAAKNATLDPLNPGETFKKGEEDVRKAGDIVQNTIVDVVTKILNTVDDLLKQKTGVTGTEQKADGGFISGPGSGTSDSIPARLSNGEYVIRAAAVRNYGVGLFHALNDMALQGFAAGGLIGAAPVRFAEGGAVGGHSVVNLSIDGNRFDGLKAPQDVAQKLTSYAISRQTAQTGRTPSWVR